MEQYNYKNKVEGQIMVFVDLHKILEKIKKEIVRRFEEINIDTYPVDFAWLLYALQNEKDVPLFSKNFEKLIVWSFSDDSERKDRNIGALSLCVYLMEFSNQDNYAKILEKIEIISKRNLKGSAFKYSVLNNPGEMYLLSLISDYLEEDLKKKLLEISTKNITGSIPRKILFSASSINFGGNSNKIENTTRKIFTELKRIEDIITALWFCEKYDVFLENIPSLLIKLEEMFFAIEEDDRISIPTQYLALLYEAINREIHGPHPLTLFYLYPFEQKLREICEEYFKGERYSTAISEALKRIKEILMENAKKCITDPEEQKKLEETNERDLIRKLLNPRIPQNFKKRDPNEIPIKFCELKNPSEMSFQEGLALLLEGAWIAFRHPEAHCSENHWLRKFEPYEAIAILALIDYLWKKLKRTKIQDELMSSREGFNTTEVSILMNAQ